MMGFDTSQKYRDGYRTGLHWTDSYRPGGPWIIPKSTALIPEIKRREDREHEFMKAQYRAFMNGFDAGLRARDMLQSMGGSTAFHRSLVVSKRGRMTVAA